MGKVWRQRGAGGGLALTARTPTLICASQNEASSFSRTLHSDDFIGIAGARAQTKLAKYFFTIIFSYSHTGRIIVIYMYHIIRLHFLVDWEFLQVHIFNFIGFAVVLVYHGPQGYGHSTNPFIPPGS